jgi:hypothetical protein
MSLSHLETSTVNSWSHYPLSSGAVTLTGRGKNAIQEHPNLLQLAHDYRMSQMGRTVTSLSGVRAPFRHGGNSDVYHLADASDIVVKEGTDGKSLYYAMRRMDILKTIIEYGVPRWVDVPDHLALVDSRDLPRQYMFMQKIDSGITVQDINDFRQGDTALDRRVTASLGSLSSQDKAEVQGRFTMSRNLLDNFMVGNGIDPGDYLTDWHEGNVLVEKLSVPIADSSFRLWVIDQ